MTAGSSGDVRRIVPQPWATGRHKRAPAPVPARPVLSHRRPAHPIDLTAPRPRVVDDVSLLGFSRFTRGRVGARLFRLFFLLVFAGIAVQMVFSMIEPFAR